MLMLTHTDARQRSSRIRPVTRAERWGEFPPLAAFLSVFVPSLCASCEQPRAGLGGAGVCAACWGSVPELPPATCCRACALPDAGDPCPDCRRLPQPIGRGAAAAPYAGPAAAIVRAYKFRGFDLLAPPLAARMAAAAARFGLLEDRRGTALVPVPSTGRRNRERGYDPALLLALELARALRLPVASPLRRVRDTAPQSSLPAARRRANVAGAFEARRPRHRRLLLVDDVLTTGATAFAAALALRTAGAEEVDVLAFARTPDPDDFRYPHPSGERGKPS